MTTQQIANPTERLALKSAIAEVIKSLQKIELERQAIKDISSNIEDSLGIKKKIFRKLANTMYKHNFTDVQAENTAFEYLYEAILEQQPKGQQS